VSISLEPLYLGRLEADLMETNTVSKSDCPQTFSVSRRNLCGYNDQQQSATVKKFLHRPLEWSGRS